MEPVPEPLKAALKDTFNSVAEGYDCPPLRFFQRSAAHLISLLDLRSDDQVLDVATGTGTVALLIAQRVPRGRVLGIDFSERMLEQARQKAAKAAVPNVEFVQMDMEELQVQKRSFDKAVCAFGIFFSSDMQAQLRRIAETVRPGGVVAFTCFAEDYLSPLRDLMLERLTTRFGASLPPQTWRQIATDAGCRDLLSHAGLSSIRVERKDVGYLIDSPEQWWDILWNAGFRRLLTQLSAPELERFKREHLEEIATLRTPAGIQLSINVLFALGCVGSDVSI